MNGEKEIKIESINYHIFNNIKNIRHINYEILMIICNKIRNKQNLNNHEINKQIEELWKKSKKCLGIINTIINIIIDKHYTINVDYLKNLFITRKYFNRLYQSNNLYSLLYKKLINDTSDYFFRPLIKSELNNAEFQIRIRNMNYCIQNNLESKPINEWINEFIINNYKDKIYEKQIKENEKCLRNIYFNCETDSCKDYAYININVLNFHIFIKFPLKFFNISIFYSKIKVNLNFKYDNEDIPETPYTNKTRKLFEKNDIKEKRYILIEKIKKLMNDRVYQINKAIFEEEKSNILKSDISGEISLNHLIEFCKRFIYYIHEYSQLFTTKCGVCEKVVKYSIKEKSFLPPYYKIYRERNNKNNEDNLKLFYHEECFRKIALPYL